MMFEESGRAAAGQRPDRVDTLRKAPRSGGEAGQLPVECLMSRSIVLVLFASASLGALMLSGPFDLRMSAHGQDKAKGAKKAGKGTRKPLSNTRSLDIKAEQAQAAFVREADELAMQYIEAGHIDKARALLQSVVAMNPQLTAIQKKIDQIDEGLLNANDFEVELNASHGWETTGASVFENRAIRFHVEGSYRFDVGGSVGPAGFPDKDPAKDMVAGLPCGAVIGIIVANGKPGKPFLIGEGLDYTPKENGVLALRVNAPAGNRNTGKLKVSISGWIKSP